MKIYRKGQFGKRVETTTIGLILFLVLVAIGLVAVFLRLARSASVP